MSAKLIVADAGPLIALGIAGLLPVCIDMLGGLAVPQAVLQECTSDPSAPGAAVIEQLHLAQAFEVIPQTALTPLDAALAQGLGTGEIAVLSYAAGHQLVALVDERRARRVAQHLKTAVIGSGTLLVQLKRQGLISNLQTVFAVWQKHGYFVSDKIKNEILLRSQVIKAANSLVSSSPEKLPLSLRASIS
jgi:predicted nucleic acid-binding protein